MESTAHSTMDNGYYRIVHDLDFGDTDKRSIG